MRGLIAAILFMTRLPLPARLSRQADFDRIMPWLPATGLIVGLPVTFLVWSLAQQDGWVAALLGLLGWIALTGALHLDGLADVFDGLGAAHGNPARLSKVMADPHVGSFGVVAIAAQLATKLVLLHAVVEAQSWLALLLVPLAARIGPVAWTMSLPSLHSGLGSRLRAGAHRVHLLAWLSLVAASSLVVPPLLALVPALVGWHLFVARRLGGISGDSLGAGIELTEIWLLMSIVVAGWVQ